jgi:hypothetical protein
MSDFGAWADTGKSEGFLSLTCPALHVVYAVLCEYSFAVLPLRELEPSIGSSDGRPTATSSAQLFVPHGINSYAR